MRQRQRQQRHPKQSTVDDTPLIAQEMAVVDADGPAASTTPPPGFEAHHHFFSKTVPRLTSWMTALSLILVIASTFLYTVTGSFVTAFNAYQSLWVRIGTIGARRAYLRSLAPDA